MANSSSKTNTLDGLDSRAPFARIDERLRDVLEVLRRSYRRGARELPLDPDDSVALGRWVEGEVIPRLMLAHRLAPAAAAPKTRRAVSREAQLRFTQLVLDGEPHEAEHYVEQLIEDGVQVESILLGLMTDSARRIGELWERDERGFGEVTLALLRRHQILRRRTLPPTPAPSDGASRPSILLTTACGDQHVFGVMIVAEFMRSANWRVVVEPASHFDAVRTLLRSEPFDLLGISASSVLDVDSVRDEITRYRAVSSNASLRVIVGGNLFADEPARMSRVGADALATDAKRAVATAERLIGRTASAS